MTVKRKPGGKYIEAWRDAVAKGRARKRAVRPKRDILSVQNALKGLKLRYCQEVSFWNVFHRGKHDDLDGGLQWVDFVVKGQKKLFVIILDDPKKRWKNYEKDYHKNKMLGLAAKDIFVVMLPAGRTSQEYQVSIYMHTKRYGL